MDRYNTSHCLDITAALAITKADRDLKKSKAARKRLVKKFAGLTYRIGEVAQLMWIDGVLVDARRHNLPNAARNTIRQEGEATGSALLPA